MGRQLLFGILVYLFTSFSGHAAELFVGGLAQLIEYKSALPCEVSNGSKCNAVSGIMGYALDTASQAGLLISQVVIKKNNKGTSSIYVETKSYGTCLVDTKNPEQMGEIGFLCSNKGLQKDNFNKIDHVLTLVKNDKKDSYEIQDVTSTKKLNRSL